METQRRQEKQPTKEGKEKIPFADQIVIATNCLYKNYQVLPDGQQRNPADTDGIRGDLAIKLINNAINLGIRVVVCDGESSSEFLSFLDGLTSKGLTVVKSDTPGRAPQRRKAFETAASLSNGKAVIYAQAEKCPLIEKENLIRISKQILDGSADIVIPGRNPELFEQSYPYYMWQSEIRVNKTYDWIIQRAGLMTKKESFDWFFGVVVFKNDQEIVDLFLKKYEIDGSIYSRTGANPNPEMNSDGHYFPIIEALFRKKRVVSIEIPFTYPETQKANEMSPETITAFRERRQKDGAAYRLEAMHFLAFLRGIPESRIKESSSPTTSKTPSLSNLIQFI